MPCTFQLPLKLPGLPSFPPRSPKCQNVPHLALNSASPAFHFDRLSAGSLNSFLLLKAAWPRPSEASCPELNQKMIFLVSVFLIYLALFIYFFLLYFHFTDVDDFHCRSMDTFSWLLAPNAPAYRLASCRFLQDAFFSHPHPSSWPLSSSWLQPCDNSHCLCLLLFPRYSPSSSQTSLHLHLSIRA